MDVDIVPVQKGLCVFVSVLRVVRNGATQHRGDGTIEPLDLAVNLRLVLGKVNLLNVLSMYTFTP